MGSRQRPEPGPVCSLRLCVGTRPAAAPSKDPHRPPGPPSGVREPEGPPTPVVPQSSLDPVSPQMRVSQDVSECSPAGQPPTQRHTHRLLPAWGHRGVPSLQEAGAPSSVTHRPSLPESEAPPRGRPQGLAGLHLRCPQPLRTVTPAPTSTKRQQRGLAVLATGRHGLPWKLAVLGVAPEWHHVAYVSSHTARGRRDTGRQGVTLWHVMVSRLSTHNFI